jgi:hypothetical protein
MGEKIIGNFRSAGRRGVSVPEKLSPEQLAEMKIFTYVNAIVQLHMKLKGSDAEFDLGLMSAEEKLDEMKLSSPTKYAEEGDFFRNRVVSRVKFLKKLRKFVEKELEEDQEQKKKKIKLV